MSCCPLPIRPVDTAPTRGQPYGNSIWPSCYRDQRNNTITVAPMTCLYGRKITASNIAKPEGIEDIGFGLCYVNFCVDFLSFCVDFRRVCVDFLLVCVDFLQACVDF